MSAIAPASFSRCGAESAGFSVSTRATAMTLVASGRFKGCSRGRISTSPERSRMVCARKATPVSFGLMKCRSVGRSHAQRITRGTRSIRVAALRSFITDRTFVIPKASEATSMVAPVTNRISFFDSACFMRRYGKAASVPQQIIQKKFGCRSVVVMLGRILDHLDRLDSDTGPLAIPHEDPDPKGEAQDRTGSHDDRGYRLGFAEKHDRGEEIHGGQRQAHKNDLQSSHPVSGSPPFCPLLLAHLNYRKPKHL